MARAQERAPQRSIRQRRSRGGSRLVAVRRMRTTEFPWRRSPQRMYVLCSLDRAPETGRGPRTQDRHTQYSTHIQSTDAGLLHLLRSH